MGIQCFLLLLGCCGFFSTKPQRLASCTYGKTWKTAACIAISRTGTGTWRRRASALRSLIGTANLAIPVCKPVSQQPGEPFGTYSPYLWRLLQQEEDCKGTLGTTLSVSEHYSLNRLFGRAIGDCVAYLDFAQCGEKQLCCLGENIV